MTFCHVGKPNVKKDATLLIVGTASSLSLGFSCATTTTPHPSNKKVVCRTEYNRDVT